MPILQTPIPTPDMIDAKDLVEAAKWAIGITITIVLAVAGWIVALRGAIHGMEQRLIDRMDRRDKEDADAIWDCIDKSLRPVTALLDTRVAVLEDRQAVRGAEIDKHATRLLPGLHHGTGETLRAIENDGAESLDVRQLDLVRIAAESQIVNPQSTPAEVASAMQIFLRVKALLAVPAPSPSMPFPAVHES